jgi:hypothetical protein
MAIITKMSISPAEPYCNITTKFTLKADKLFSVFVAVFCLNWATLRTNKILWVKLFVFLLIHCLSTIFSATKVWFFTFKTLKIGIKCQCVFFFIFIIWRLWISKLFVFILILIFKSLPSFVDNKPF